MGKKIDFFWWVFDYRVINTIILCFMRKKIDFFCLIDDDQLIWTSPRCEDPISAKEDVWVCYICVS